MQNQMDARKNSKGKFEMKKIIYIIVLIFIISKAIKIANAEIEIKNAEEHNNYIGNISISYFPITSEERWIIESIVAGEAGNQSLEGKMAVANCILNCCVKDSIRPQEVKEKYYTGNYDIDLFEQAYEQYKPGIAQEIRDAVSLIFDDGKLISTNMYWFYNPDICDSPFHESMKYIITIGEHKFFGYWEE